MCVCGIGTFPDFNRRSEFSSGAKQTARRKHIPTKMTQRSCFCACSVIFFFSSSPWCRLSCDCRLGQCMWEDLLCLPPPGASCQIGQHHEGNWFPPWQTPQHSITEAPHQLVRNSDAQQQKSYYKSQIPALFNWSFKACRSLTPSAYHLIILLPTHYNICISTVTSHIQPPCRFANLHLRLCDC